MRSSETFLFSIPFELAGKRLDAALSELIPNISRTKIQEAIKNGNALMDNKPPKIRDKVIGGEVVQVTISLEQDSLQNAIAEEIPLDIIYEDADILVLNKPAGLVVHPAVGNPDGTLMNGILHHHKEASHLPRAGIVHRLDKDTSGIMVVSKTLEAYYHLTNQLKDHSMGRTYHAIAIGEIISGQTIDIPIGRHHKDRKKMSAQAIGKEAVTHIRVKERFRGHTYIECHLETGRTHQIRVHMNFIHHPLFGDTTYGGRLRLPPKIKEEYAEILRKFKRQALHAKSLHLVHPTTQKEMTFDTDLPDDLMAILNVFQNDAHEHNWIY